MATTLKSVSLHPQKRKNTRFKPDAGTYARIDLNAQGVRFKPTILALVTEESFGGCGIVVIENSEFKVGSVIRIKVGKLKMMRAEVRWRKSIDPRVTLFGLQYLE